MPSTGTTRNRFEKQGVGENANTWGTKLNVNHDLIDEALDGVTSFTLSSSKTLSSTNYASDESRKRVLDITSGTGGTVTIPNVEKTYLVRNACSGPVTITTGSGTTAIIPTLTSTWIFCAGGNVVRSIDTTDLWTYKRLGSNFTHATTLAATVLGIDATEVSASTEYEYDGTFYVKISSGSVVFEWGWMGGLTDGVAEICANTGAAHSITGGSVAADLSSASVAIGTAYRPVFVRGHFIVASSGKTGTARLNVRALSGTPTITVRAGSFIKFRRTFPA